ncbi:tail fiber domain-containing protein [Bradyrhizobium sp. SZCCHNS2005]|uniref:tail fiber domain-containing protein n=1 Tax=Bradyrhizobium sp. SZCCHNS2005 TaxID=3057303 RepID=UPI0028EFE285|nr:tail fiber domain-containing protein [Bradyrhizobium sp. SZCCHNS2005]
MTKDTALHTIWLALLFALMTSSAHAQKWTNFAYVSATSTLITNTLCYSDGRDLACDGAAGLLVTSGTVSIPTLYATTVSTTNLTVNGVAITGNASGDRITSGTTSMVANSGTSIISITNAGVTAGYFNSNGVLTVPGISTTSNLTSITTLYASGNVGIGTSSPDALLVVADTTTTSVRGIVSSQHNSNVQAPTFLTRKSRGTVTVPTGVLSGDYIADLGATAHNGTAYSLVKNFILAKTTEDWSTTSNGYELEFTTNPNSSTTPQQRMVISANGNVGIGTSTPAASLQVSSAAPATGLVIGSGAIGNAAQIQMWASSSPDAGLITFGDGTGWKLHFGKSSNNGATKFMTIQDNGNVGIGTTNPSLTLTVGGPIFSANPAADTGIYMTAAPGGFGILQGTNASNAIVHNIVLQYYGGNVGIGTTITPTATLEVSGTISASALYASSGNVGIGTTVSGSGVDISGAFHTTNNTTAPPPSDVRGGLSVAWNRSGGRAEVNFYNVYENANTSYIFSQKTGASTYTDIMTLLGNGNVGVATRYPSTTLHVVGAVIFGPNGSPLTSGGIQFDAAGTNGRIYIGRGNADTVEEFYYNGVGRVGGISINTASTSYNTTSDRRLKENIVDTNRGLADLGRIRVEDFNFIADPSRTRVQGFIAQDLYKVYPEAVTVGGDDPKEKPWSVDYGRLTPLLVKSLQQQQHQIEALKAANDNQTSEIRELRKEIDELKAARK